MSYIQGPKDFYAGLLFIGIGAAAILIALNYPMGTAARMGPGYFPRALGGLLIMLGALSVLRSLRLAGEPLPRWRWRPLVVALGSVVVFGLIVQYAGLALSTVFLVFTASAASDEFRPKEAALAGVLMAALCVGVFVYALNIQLSVWPSFI